MTYVINLGVPPLLFAQVLLRARAVHVERTDRGVLDYADRRAIRNLLVALPILGTAGGREVCMVGGDFGVAACGLHRADSLDRYDADAAARSVARYVFGFSAGRVPAETGSDDGAAMADDDGCGLFIGGLWLVYLAGRSTFTTEEKKFAAGLGGKLAAVFGPGVPDRRNMGCERAARCGEGRAGGPSAVSLVRLCGAMDGWRW